jgi:hypothetical protein
LTLMVELSVSAPLVFTVAGSNHFPYLNPHSHSFFQFIFETKILCGINWSPFGKVDCDNHLENWNVGKRISRRQASCSKLDF